MAFDHIRDMHDIALKPRLLRSLLKKHVPDEKHLFEDRLELSHIVTMVKTHRLLAVSAESADPKLVENWEAAVDAWVNRLLMLASSNMPDKCWAGVCLLGLTCQECSSERFLASYSLWLQKLQLHMQIPADSHFVKVASCASLSDLFTRLARIPRVKKDATSQAAKLIQPVLKLLNEDGSEAVWEGAVCLLCTFITYFPFSIHRCYESAEAAVVSKIMSGKCSVKMLKELGHCLALLPKSRGDEDSWVLMMQKILFSINVQLNDIFQGVEEESKSNEAMRVLVPPGKDPPPPLGSHTIGESLDQRTKRPQQLHMSSISTLMCCCCTMLTSSYPVQVRVPIRPLVVLAGRVLMVDGSLSQALFPFTTAMQQEFICSELPVLHLYSLELLNAVIKGVHSFFPNSSEIYKTLGSVGKERRWNIEQEEICLDVTWSPHGFNIEQEEICLDVTWSPHGFSRAYYINLDTHSLKRVEIYCNSLQLLPHVAEIVRLLTEYFKKCVLPDLRIKVYLVIRMLLMSMGVGVAVYLAQELISNAFIDLDYVACKDGGTSSSTYLNASNEVLLQPCRKKRKHASTTGSLEEHPDTVDLEVGVSKTLTPISVKIAALEALEALLTVGGALGAESWRPSIDDLLINLVVSACKGGWAREEKHIFLSGELVPTWADFQLTALRTLLASLLSPSRFRPPNLARGLEIFRRGKQETGTKLAEFCTHALLALEVLIHPRDLPLIDFSSPSNTFDGVNSRFPDVYSYGNKQNAPFSGSIPGKGLDDSNYGDDHLYESWLANNDEIDIPVTDSEKPSATFRDPSPEKIPDTEKPSETFHNPSPKKIPPVADSFGTIVPVETREEIDTAGSAKRIHGKGDEIMAVAHQPQELIEQGGTRVDDVGESTGAQLTSRIVSDSVVSDRVEGEELATGKDVPEVKADLFATKGLSAAVGTSILERGKHFSADLASESSMESLPDIVDGDPDSD